MSRERVALCLVLALFLSRSACTPSARLHPCYLPGCALGQPPVACVLIGQRPPNRLQGWAGGAAYVKPYFILISSNRGFKSLIRRV